MMLSRAVAVLVCLLIAGQPLVGRQAAAGSQDDAAALQALVASTVGAFDAPGVAVAIVKDGKVLLARGYGSRRAGDPAPVDDRTLFYTASVTKAFTITALARVADAGKLRIDDPVRKYLPAFSVGDPVLTEQLTVRDLMAHRTGLPRADLLMFSGLPQQDILRRLEKLQPVAPVRSRFTYQNQMYLVLGLLLESLTGTSWSRAVEDGVLKPIGFQDGNAAGLGRWGTGAGASPHARTATGVSAIDLVPRDPYGAGGVNASARDMAAWLQFQMGDGTASGARVVLPNVLPAQHGANILVAPNPSMPSSVLAAYGLGWFVHDYDGRKVVQHGGNGEGWTSLVWMAPQERIGIAVLTNMHNSALPQALAYTIADRLLARPSRDWVAEFKRLESRLGPPPLPTLSTPLTPLSAADAGAYRHPLYGDAMIRARDGQLVFEYGILSARIEGLSAGWNRSDLTALLGAGRISRRNDGGVVTVVLEAGGERFEFTGVR